MKVSLTSGVLALALLTLLANRSYADSFNVAGSVTLTQNSLTWSGNTSPFPADKTQIGPDPTGIYSALGGTSATINDVGGPTEPVGAAFSAQSFLAFDADPALSPLLINFIFPGVFSSSECAVPPAAGQTCTPSASAYSFVNMPTFTSTATWVVAGVSADGLETWSGVFTSQFGEPYQSVLAALAAGGSVTETYSATMTVSRTSVVAPVPEPSSLLLLGPALLGLGALARRRIGWCNRHPDIFAAHLSE